MRYENNPPRDPNTWTPQERQTRKEVNRAIAGAIGVAALLGTMNSIEREIDSGHVEPAEVMSVDPRMWVYAPIKNGVLELRQLTHDGTPDAPTAVPHDELPLPGPGPDVEGPALPDDSRS